MTNQTDDQLTLLVFTGDCIERLGPLIASTSWIRNRVAIDMRSEDRTAETLVDAGFDLLSIEKEIFTDQLRNKYLGIVKTPWTLILDSDEFLADDAQELIEGLIASAGNKVVGFGIPRHNYFKERKLMGPGWYPDHQIRLFRSDQIVYSSGHHRPPRPKVEGGIIEELEAPSCLHIHHNSYPNIEEFLLRQLHYAVTDEFDSDPRSFDFDDYSLEAIRQFNFRYEGRSDGELSYALALIMYWDQVVRGLIHWEKTGYKGALTEHIPKQVFADNEFSKLTEEINQLRQELTRHQDYKSSFSWWLIAPLRVLYSWASAVLRGKF